MDAVILDFPFARSKNPLQSRRTLIVEVEQKKKKKTLPSKSSKNVVDIHFTSHRIAAYKSVLVLTLSFYWSLWFQLHFVKFILNNEQLNILDYFEQSTKNIKIYYERFFIASLEPIKH